VIRRDARAIDALAGALDGPAGAAVAAEPAVVPLRALAEQLQALPLGPRPEFRDALRTRLMAVAAVAEPDLAAPLFASPAERARAWVEGWRVQRSLAATAAGMAAVVGIAGVGVASSRSLPGDPFYGVKRGAEGVQLSLARGDVAKGERHLQFAETRLEEVARLVGEDVALGSAGLTALGGSTAERVTDALADMDEATSRGTRLLTEAYREDRDADPLKTLAAFAKRQKSGLAEVLPALPAAARPAAEESLALIADVEMRAAALLNNGVCGQECAPAPVSPSPSATPQPQPQPEPTSTDSLGPQPCSCSPEPQPEPTATSEPQPEPSRTSSPTPSSSPSPSPSSEPSRVPVPLPSPVDEIVEDLIDEVEDLLPTPLPTLPAAPQAPAAPAADQPALPVSRP
jgi:hypothetical protein